jgi:hypothetical protein
MLGLLGGDGLSGPSSGTVGATADMKDAMLPQLAGVKGQLLQSQIVSMSPLPLLHLSTCDGAAWGMPYE